MLAEQFEINAVGDADPGGAPKDVLETVATPASTNNVFPTSSALSSRPFGLARQFAQIEIKVKSTVGGRLGEDQL